MHAPAISSHVNPTSARRRCATAGTVKPGQHFVRPGSLTEVLALLSHTQIDTRGPVIWAVVIATKDDTRGYLPGQLVSLGRGDRVRVLREARSAAFVLEH